MHGPCMAIATLLQNSVIKASSGKDKKDASIIDDDAESVTITDPSVKLDLGAIAKGFIADKIKEYLDKKKLKKETAIILKGVRYDLVKPQIESCSNCDLDKFCDKFKEALCDMLEGKHCGKVFKKQ